MTKTSQTACKEIILSVKLPLLYHHGLDAVVDVSDAF
jgi:hypothetical protein